MKEGKELRMEGHLDEGAPKDALKQECYGRKRVRNDDSMVLLKKGFSNKYRSPPGRPRSIWMQ